MEARVSLITLGVKDLNRSRAFYEKLGWKASSASAGDVVFFRTEGTVVALFPREALAEDACVPAEGSGFRGFTIAYNVREKEQVAKTLTEAERAGAKILKKAQDVFWGGHSGYFQDPDGFAWEVAWNPGFSLDDRGMIQLP